MSVGSRQYLSMRHGVWCAVAISLMLAAGCSRVVPKLDEVLSDKRTAYKKSESLPDLEVPPELTTDAIQDRMAIPEGGRSASYSTYQQRRTQRESDSPAGAPAASAETEQVIVVDGEPDVVWGSVRRFWHELGYRLDIDDPVVGTMQTDWRENGVELTRDRFKVFVEAGQKPGTTLLFFAHVGEALSPDGEDLVWQSRPRDLDVEGKLAERLKKFVASGRLSTVLPVAVALPAVTDVVENQEHEAPVEPSANHKDSQHREQSRVEESSPVSTPPTSAEPIAKASARTELEGERAELISAGEGKLYLAVEQDFALAWRSTGLALDQAGLTIEQADKSKGVYYIRFLEEANDDEGSEKKKRGWSRLAFWKRDGDSDQYQLSLTGVGDITEVVILNENGKWDTSKNASHILVRLHQELNKLL